MHRFASAHFARRLIPLLVAVVVSLVARDSLADLLVNGSFENGTYTFGGDGGQDLPVGSTVISGWTVFANNVAPIQNANAFGVVAQNGNVSLDLQSYNDGIPYGGVQQAVATAVGQAYDLSFWIGVNNSVGIGVGPAAVTASATGNAPLVLANTSTATGQQWQQVDYPFVATSTSTTVGLQGQLTTGGAYIGLDNAMLIAVPEPVGAALALAMVGAPMLRRRRR